MTPDQRAELLKRTEIIRTNKNTLIDARRAALNEMIREEEIEIEKILFMQPEGWSIAPATARLTLLLAERSRG